ncbi:MAG: hypothetical protein LBO75_05495 [Bifidobacteriaceae bacterium]|nr:hypothetical protein [Bifidobacteriaceae bacterium]
MSETDYYELIGLEPEAEDEAIRQALKSTKKRLSDRRRQHPKESVRLEAQGLLEVLADAEEALLDPDRRQAYNQKRAARRAAEERAARRVAAPVVPIDTVMPDAAPAPFDTSSGPGGVGQEVLDRARHYSDIEEWKLAHKSWGQATARFPNDPQVWAEWAKAAMELRNSDPGHRSESLLDDALMGASEAIRLDPENGWAHMLLGNVRSSQRDHQAAKRAYELAIKFTPDNPYIYWNLGLTLVRDLRDRNGLSFLYRSSEMFAETGNSKDHESVMKSFADFAFPYIGIGDSGNAGTPEEKIENAQFILAFAPEWEPAQDAVTFYTELAELQREYGATEIPIAKHQKAKQAFRGLRSNNSREFSPLGWDLVVTRAEGGWRAKERKDEENRKQERLALKELLIHQQRVAYTWSVWGFFLAGLGPLIGLILILRVKRNANVLIGTDEYPRLDIGGFVAMAFWLPVALALCALGVVTDSTIINVLFWIVLVGGLLVVIGSFGDWFEERRS